MNEKSYILYENDAQEKKKLKSGSVIFHVDGFKSARRNRQAPCGMIS